MHTSPSPSPSSSVSFPEFCRSVLPLYSPPVRRKRTREKLLQALAEFGPHCPTTREIHAGSIAAWMADWHGRRSPIASFSVLRAFAAAVRTGHAELGIVPLDPFRGRPPRRWWPDGDLDPPERTRHLTAAQARRLLDRADREWADAAGGGPRWRAHRLATLVRLYLYTGLRASEGLGLRVEDVGLAAGAIEVRPNGRRHLKTRAARRRVPIAEPLRGALESWLPEVDSEWLFPGSRREGPWSGGPPGYKPLDQVAALGRRAGIEGVTILSLRHTFATLGESLGFGELLLQRLLGHRQRRTQLHYRHEDLEAMRTAADRLRL